MTANELMQAIWNSIGSDLGTYEDGSNAFWLRPPEPPNQAVAGIECIVENIPRGMPENSGAWQKHFNKLWQVILIAHGRDVDLAPTLLKLQRSTLNIQRTIVLPATIESNAFVRLEVFDPEMVNVIR